MGDKDMKKLCFSAACGALALTACAPEAANQRGDISSETNETSAAPRAGMANADAAAPAAEMAPPALTPPVTTSAPPTNNRSISNGSPPPAISRAAAPGVAFDHQYSFTLPANAISGVQEQHSRLCADLGVSQCEITGVDYRQSEGAVRAQMSFLLAPAVASMFSTSALAAVEAADGSLTDGAIQGENIKQIVDATEQEIATRTSAIAQLQAQAKSLRAGSAERVRINQEIADLKALNDGGRKTQADARAKLTRTPVTFTYQSATGWFGTSGASNSSAGSYASASLSTMLSLVAIVAPWALLLGLLIWGWRRFGSARKTTQTETPAS